MQYRTLGKTGLRVSEVSLGGLYTSSLGGGLESARAIVHKAVSLGINYIDTAPRYADSEFTLGHVLPDVEQPLILSTKLGGRPEPFDPKSRDGLMWSVEESLKLLKRDVIDMLLIHEPDRPQLFNWWKDPFKVYGPVIEVLEELKQDGVIRYTGIGGTTSTQIAHLMRSGHFDVVLTAFQYSLLFREADNDIFPAAEEMNMGVILGSALQQGGLGRRYDEVVRSKPPWLARPRQAQFLALYDLLDETGLELPEMALRFALNNPAIHTVLIGPKTAEQVEQSVVAASRGPLPVDIMGRIDEIWRICPMRPFEEPMVLPFRNPKYFGPGMANHG
ncbi:MAG: aldo/keto reductase [Phycisphaeraceae bacterium]